MVSRAKSIILLACLSTLLNIIDSEDKDVSNEEDPIKEALLLIKVLRRMGQQLLPQDRKMLPLMSPYAPDPPIGASSLNERLDNYYRRQDYENNLLGPQPDKTTTPDAHKTEKNYNATLHVAATVGTDRATDATSENTTPPKGTTAKTVIHSSTTAGTSTSAKMANSKKRRLTILPKLSTTASRIHLKSHLEAKAAGSTPTPPPPNLHFRRNLEKVESDPQTNANSTEEAKNAINPETDEEISNVTLNKHRLTLHRPPPADDENKNVNDPVMSQVASELANEMQLMTINGTDVSHDVKMDPNGAKAKFVSTLKIHLGKSTRYPIPFPQNHALCYTDPHNGLCRTPV